LSFRFFHDARIERRIWLLIWPNNSALAPPIPTILDLCSSEEDAYHTTSRSASVLSDLLFTTVQIDPHTPDTGTSDLFVSNCAHHYCHAGQRRAGRFTCTSQLELQSSDGGDSPKVLEAEGVRASKREARRIACARLLALLFPECRTMVQVKTTAEAARTKYAASKGKTKQPHEPHCFEASDPPIPAALQEGPARLIQSLGDMTAATADSKQTEAFRQLSRKKELDALVEKAPSNTLSCPRPHLRTL
jgi:hypothetical protein